MMLLAAEGASLVTVTTAVGQWMSLAGTLLNTITGNSVLCFVFCAPLVFVGIGIVKRLVHV